MFQYIQNIMLCSFIQLQNNKGFKASQKIKLACHLKTLATFDEKCHIWYNCNINIISIDNKKTLTYADIRLFLLRFLTPKLNTLPTKKMPHIKQKTMRGNVYYT
ncbi:unnamed protein product [Meganyctiphanes norvegica]|uniref:LAGLIDADG homing endonuclease n=1 Tax=Meganyctiphanes norvegica TaxID=48144 RepID=A0AAV2S198_MEGNR